MFRSTPPSDREWAEAFERICADLQAPARGVEPGPTPENPNANRADFVRTCHGTWKALHEEAIGQILETEAALRFERSEPIGPTEKALADYYRAIWRRVNDSIVWYVFGIDRQKVKRLFLGRSRTYLAESNAPMVMDFLRHQNANPLTLALWNDATSSLDVGDVLLVPDGLAPVPRLIELKSGEVNAQVVKSLSLEGPELEAHLQDLRAKYGEHGVKQRERVLRQKQTTDQALSLLNTRQGLDPYTKQNFQIVGVDFKQESYDDTFNALLLAALEKRGEMIEYISECVWVYANADPSVTPAEAEKRFEEALNARLPRTYRRAGARPERDIIRPLVHSFHEPLARPLFLRGLAPHVVSSVIRGELTCRVFLYFDLMRFGGVVESCGIEMREVVGKEYRRRMSAPPKVRVAIFSGSLPVIISGHWSQYLTESLLRQILYDGTTPRTIARTLAMQLARTTANGGPPLDSEGNPVVYADVDVPVQYRV